MNIGGKLYSIVEKSGSLPFITCKNDLNAMDALHHPVLKASAGMPNTFTFEGFNFQLTDSTTGTYICTSDTTINKRVDQINFQIITDTVNTSGYAIVMPDPVFFPDPKINISISINKKEDHIVEGTFSGTLSNSLGSYSTISDGQFRMHYYKE